MSDLPHRDVGQHMGQASHKHGSRHTSKAVGSSQGQGGGADLI